MTLYGSNGKINTTSVPGSSYTGLYAADGSWNIVVNSSGSYVGLHHACGAYNAFVVTDPSASFYAPNGSMNVIANGSSPSGFSPVQPSGSGSSPVLWTPLNDTGLVEWWNAQDTAKMTFNGSNISSWTGEKNIHNFSQATPANQAAYTSTINGLTVTSIVGTVVMPGDVFVQPGTYTFAAIFQPANAASGAGLLNADNGGSQRQAFYLFQNGGFPATLAFSSGGNFQTNGSAALVNGTTIVHSAINTGTSLTVATNGTNGTPVAITGTPATATIGFNYGTGNAGLGLIGDIVLSATATTSVKQKVEGFLAWKYGLQASLPGGHPYASRAPLVSDP